MNEQSNPDKKSLPVKRAILKGLIVLLGIVLVMMLAGFFLPGVVRRGPMARAVATRVQIASLVTALGTYQAENGAFPQGADGLICLTKRPPGATNWRGPYLNAPSVPKDPWGHAYIYEYPGKHNPQSYDLSAVGPDGLVYGNWVQK